MNESPSEVIKRKRAEAAARKEREAELKQFKSNSDDVAAEVARQASRSRSKTQPVEIQNDDLVKGKDLDRIVDSINKMNLTSFVASKETWFSDLVDALYTLTKRMSAVAQDFDGNGVRSIEKALNGAASKLETAVDKLKSVKVESDDDLKEVLSDMRDTLQAFDYAPTVTVPAPNVTVSPSELNLKPLQTALEDGLRPLNKIDLSNYRAQDLDEQEQGVQFIGFVNPSGNWFIIKNVEADNTIRYKFGKDKYSQAWGKAPGYEYLSLDKAVNAL